MAWTVHTWQGDIGSFTSRKAASELAKQMRDQNKLAGNETKVTVKKVPAIQNPARVPISKKIRVSARDLAKTKAYITQDANHKYILVSETGARFSLSTADAIRSQKSGVPYKAPRR